MDKQPFPSVSTLMSQNGPSPLSSSLFRPAGSTLCSSRALPSPQPQVLQAFVLFMFAFFSVSQPILTVRKGDCSLSGTAPACTPFPHHNSQPRALPSLTYPSPHKPYNSLHVSLLVTGRRGARTPSPSHCWTCHRNSAFCLVVVRSNMQETWN